MDFSLSDDQQLLKDSVERFIERDYPFDGRQAASRSDDGFNRDTWATFAELGDAAFKCAPLAWLRCSKRTPGILLLILALARCH